MKGEASAALRLDGIQAGRAVAALGVIATHGIAHPLPGAPGAVHLLGRYGVTLFFVISGFIMIRSTGAGTFAPGSFIANRIRRVAPLYWLVCAVLLALVTISPGVMKSTVFEPSHFIRSMLFIPAYHPTETGWIFPFFKLGWTLDYEMFFYACFAALFFLTAVRRTMVLTAVFLALAVCGALFPVHTAAAVFYTRVDILAFVAGMWIAVAVEHEWTLSPTVERVGWTTSIVALAGIALLYASIREVAATQLVLIATCTIQVALLARARFVVPRWLSYAGDASYSLYLWHMFGVALVTVAIHRLAPALLYPGMALAMVAGTTVGLLVYRYVEAPMNRWLRRATRPRRAGPTTIAPLTPADGI